MPSDSTLGMDDPEIHMRGGGHFPVAVPVRFRFRFRREHGIRRRPQRQQQTRGGYQAAKA